MKRFVYTASNSVVMGGQRLSGGDETLPYTERFNDLYTETKVVAERFVLSQNGVDGLLTCSIRPSGIWGRGDQTMFRKVFESVLAGHVKVLVGGKNVKLDNSYVHNLIHGFILAAEHLVPGGTAPGQAYFINDGEPINMFEFSRPVVEACGQPWPRLRVPGRLVWFVMTAWQWFHFRFGLPKPLLEPLAVERLYLDNYFSIAKAQRDLGYQPLFSTERAMAECLPYYVDLFHQMKGAVAQPVSPSAERSLPLEISAIFRAVRNVRGGHGSSASGLMSPVALLTRAARSSRARSGSTSITAFTTSGSWASVARGASEQCGSQIPGR